LDTDWILQEAGDLKQVIFYACGPTALVEATERLVRDELQLPKDQLRLEKWG
jgi:ferredoxin-NADP reductase